MVEWDLTSVGMVLIGSSITVAGIIIGIMILGVKMPIAPFLLLTTTILVVMSAVVILYAQPRNATP